ncbi:MAG TPA: YciI-like protein [Candidatus Limnocylindrales bacterium]|nr:YciI-like protein [Candidatus Limnocylindrales bacterium]
MGYYALFYHVVDGFVERRLPFREQHLAHARSSAERGELALGGALADPADTALIVFHGDSPDAARAFAEKDPYVRNGLVQRWEVRPWNVVVGANADIPNATANRRVT